MCIRKNINIYTYADVFGLAKMAAVDQGPSYFV